jgi:very-short-patch-repair endonuclease
MKRSRARSPEAIEFARAERATANEFASTVWQWVRNRRIANQKFRREYPIPHYTADFCCVELKLILEIDGVEHFTEDGRQRDRVRDDFLESQGYRVVRIAGYVPGAGRGETKEEFS